MKKATTYFVHVFIGFDQLVTALLGGWPDESLSSYAYRLEAKGNIAGRVFRPMIDWLFSWQRLPGGHCKNAMLAEMQRTQFPRDLR